jgi:hypothetical protein
MPQYGGGISFVVALLPDDPLKQFATFAKVHGNGTSPPFLDHVLQSDDRRAHITTACCCNLCHDVYLQGLRVVKG